jgi:hypothetical protein
MIDVKLVPNVLRPGAGLLPTSEGRRAWLPQQSRFCPVLEDGNKMGFLVYPPLHEDETFQVRFEEDGNFRFTFYKQKQLVLTVLKRLSAGTGEGGTDELVSFDEQSGLKRESITRLMNTVLGVVGAPIGGVGLRGAHDFITPPGWDTIYTGVLNDLNRPHVPVLTVQVQTDWFTHPTEFRYALQPGEAVSASGYAPIGQVFFVPRTELSVGLASKEEQAKFVKDLDDYWDRKPKLAEYTSYGGVYDRQYRAEARDHAADPAEWFAAAAADGVDDASHGGVEAERL